MSSSGGKCVEFSDPNEKTRGRAKKKVALRADQSTKDNRVRALIKACKRRTPIALVAGNNYQGMPFDLGCGYVVLGWYWISYIWVSCHHLTVIIAPFQNPIWKLTALPVTID